MSTVLPHMMWSLKIQDAKIMQKIASCAPSHNFVRLSSQGIDNWQKNLVEQQYLLHMSSQHGALGPLMAEIGWRVWGTPANFKGFHILASLLHRCRSIEVKVNQTLHDV